MDSDRFPVIGVANLLVRLNLRKPTRFIKQMALHYKWSYAVNLEDFYKRHPDFRDLVRKSGFTDEMLVSKIFHDT